MARGSVTVTAAGLSPCSFKFTVHCENRLVASMQGKQMTVTVWQPKACVQHYTFAAGQPGPAGSSAAASATGELPCLALCICCSMAECSCPGLVVCALHLSAALGVRAEYCSLAPSAFV